MGEIPEEVREALSSVVTTIEVVSRQILALDKRIAELGKKKYPETALLRQVGGVGPIVALAYVLTLEHPGRFRKSRAVGPYLGLVPARSQSGDSDPQLRITKEGDDFLRRLLVQSAQYVLGPFGPDCDLRRFGLALSARGERNAKKRAVIAVARKLAVLLHRLWKTRRGLRAATQGPSSSRRGRGGLTDQRTRKRTARGRDSTVAIPIRVNAPSGRLRSGLRSPRTSARGGTPIAEIAAPFRIRPPHAPGR